MATVKIVCPKCVGTGLLGSVTETRCDYCNGTGTVSVNDTDTIAVVHTAAQTHSASMEVTTPTAVASAALRVLARGK